MLEHTKLFSVFILPSAAIATLIQYCMNWAAYFERTFTISENITAEMKRKQKRLRKVGASNEDTDHFRAEPAKQFSGSGSFSCRASQTMQRIRIIFMQSQPNSAADPDHFHAEPAKQCSGSGSLWCRASQAVQRIWIFLINDRLNIMLCRFCSGPLNSVFADNNKKSIWPNTDPTYQIVRIRPNSVILILPKCLFVFFSWLFSL